MSGRRAFSVAEVTGIIRGALSSSPDLEDVLVEGELSNLSMPASGHAYFTLKDKQASLGCVVWRSQRQLIPFRPENGMTVIAHGHIEVYDAQGRYQLYVDRLEPAGLGALALAVEQRRRALAAEGLFDEARKRPLPLLPRRVAVVTSRTGAALRDVLTITRRRAACVDVVLSPATVQGEGAVETLLLALERAQQVSGVEVILLVRGGGSLEDLMPFNDERLARAIRASRLPVVAGIGHETDTTIADLAADKRAPTPSAAAELVVPNCARLGDELLARGLRLGQAARQELALKRGAAERLRLRLANSSPERRLPGYRQDLDVRAGRLRAGLVAAVSVKRRHLDADASRLQLSSPGRRLALHQAELGSRRERLQALAAAVVSRRRDGLAGQRGRLEALSPIRTLERGYSITVDAESGALVDTVAGLNSGRRLRTRLAIGTVTSVVEAIEGGSATSTSPPERMYDGPVPPSPTETA